MVMPDDVVLALSNSGETREIHLVLSMVRDIGTKVVVMTGDPNSTLAAHADLILDAAVAREACPMGLAPTASTTAALALGDALAVALLNLRRFNTRDFRRLHPGGFLGDRLSVEVKEVMITGPGVPAVVPDTSMPEAIKVMNKSNLGVLLVVDADNTLVGIFTDGDLRRSLAQNGRLKNTPIRHFMTTTPIAISEDRLAADALEIMQTHEITVLPIVDAARRLRGMIHLHDLLGKGKFRFNQLKSNYD